MAYKRLGDKESRQAYIDNWKSIKKDFFKLETGQVYEEDEVLLKFNQGKVEEVKKMLRDFLVNDPAKPYEKIKKQKIKFRRVHVVELPLTNYMRLEIESYKISIELGEEIYFINKSQANSISKSIKLRDFLMFDEKTVIIHSYNSEGEWQYSEQIDNAEDVKEYVNFKKGLLSSALPMDQFLHRYNIK